jgi:hypothetical protein
MQRFRNTIQRRRIDPHPPTIRKIPADAVPYGSDISRNGRTLWAAYDPGGTLVAVAASSAEVRRKYREAQRQRVTVKNVEDRL